MGQVLHGSATTTRLSERYARLADDPVRAVAEAVAQAIIGEKA
jgi:hypothetical protein